VFSQRAVPGQGEQAEGRNGAAQAGGCVVHAREIVRQAIDLSGHF